MNRDWQASAAEPPSPGRWRAALAILAVALPAGAAETGGPSGTGAWAFVSLALLASAAAGYGLGLLRARQASERGLRAAHAAARQWQDLNDAWQWQTDAQHRLLSWQGPGRPPQSSCTLFTDATLAGQLRARRAFTGLQVRAAQAEDGSHGWNLRAVPRLDDLGRFDGFAGIARPTDACDALRASAAAAHALIESHEGPALVALETASGWQVRQLNPAAASLWPGLEVDAPLAACLALVPESCAAALQAAEAGASAQAEGDGWRVLPFGPCASESRGLVLACRAGAAGPAREPAPAAGEESDHFSFTVSHDLRAPIRVVEGFTRIVKEDYGRLLDRVGNDHLDRVLGAAARMNLMIDAMLTLARLSSQPLARQPVNLSQLATYVVDDLRRGGPERDADFEIEPGLVTQGDPTLLRLVLENLLGNAWKYTSRSPRAQISMRRAALGAGAAFVVRDNGAGFDMRSADRLFGLFQRLHSASEFPGHGVGLASVRRIVRRHGGEIWAEAEPGRGAAFYFTLASG